MIRVSTGICSLVLTHVSATIGTCGGVGIAGAGGAPGTAGGFGMPGTCGGAGGLGAARGGSVICFPCTSTPCTILIPRSFTCMAGAVGGMCAAKFVGYILDKTGSYLIPFAIVAPAYLIALLVIHLLLPRLEPARIPAAT